MALLYVGWDGREYWDSEFGEDGPDERDWETHEVRYTCGHMLDIPFFRGGDADIPNLIRLHESGECADCIARRPLD